MVSIKFNDAIGEEYTNPAPEWLKRLMFEEGDEFWEGASGDAGLTYSEDGNIKAGLTLIGREEHGFVVLHSYADGERTHALTTTARKDESVEVYVGGNSVHYWQSYFAPKEIAWEAVEHFLRTGERKPSLRWETAQLAEMCY